MNRKVYVGVSGGVDSAVAALILKQQGYEVTGVTLFLHGDRLRGVMPDGGGREAEDARRVCDAIGIPHVVWDESERFCREVVDVFAAEYAAGRTPNPCVLCNRAIKFGVLLDRALAEGADLLATGHYARVGYDEATGRRQLYHTGQRKDQSYFLWGLSQHQLAHTLFPLAGMDKSAIRDTAHRAGLPVAEKSDSMDVCFIPDNDHGAFLSRYLDRPLRTGNFVDASGTVLGRHKGIGLYTIGQRKGLEIALGQPMYVTHIDAESGNIRLEPEGAQMAKTLTACGVNWVSVPPLTEPCTVMAKIRFAVVPASAKAFPLSDDRVRLEFDQPQRAITPGQSAVFYRDDLLLGGGVIE